MKNHLFYLIPKADLTYVHEEDSFQSVLDIFLTSTYTALPVIDDKGHYLFTVGEGDLLRTLYMSCKHPDISLDNFTIGDIEPKIKVEAAPIATEFKEVVRMAMHQNFVPLVDDQRVLIGILRRQELISELMAGLDGDDLKKL
ncbi:MAG: CBS domain-containing protein [Eubacterium sp.]|nr:CBS domain-containing protein [Eubacterium sp.]